MTGTGRRQRKLSGPLQLFSASVAGWFAAALLAMAGVAPLRYFDLPDLFAAHLSMGIFGTAGGLSHAWLVRAAGGNFSGLRALMLSVVWATVCMAGVTPLFFIFGTPVKMALVAFYSFAVFGSVGGWITARPVGAAFCRAGSGILRYALSWGLGFGVAAMSVNPAAALLKTLLPAGAALFLSIGIMALVVGGGAGYALLTIACLRSDDRPLPEPGRPVSGGYPKGIAGEKGSGWILFFFLAAAPFYLNDFSTIFVDDWRLWLCIDYAATKIFPLVLIFWLIRSGKVGCRQLGLVLSPPASFAVVFLVGTLVGTLFLANGQLLIRSLPGYHRLGSMPIIESISWRWIDLTIGLLLVGICEELVFRGYLFMVLSRYRINRPAIAAVSALLFGLIHWGDGFHQVLITGVIGAVFMALYLASKSLPAVMLAHVAVNFIFYAGLIPVSFFRFI